MEATAYCGECGEHKDITELDLDTRKIFVTLECGHDFSYTLDRD